MNDLFGGFVGSESVVGINYEFSAAAYDITESKSELI